MTRPSPSTTDLTRYHRQMLFADLGEAGQRRLLNRHALIVGCGALGTMIAQSLCRAGVGRLTIVDRDVVELTNLQRQVLFDERDAAEGMPKAEVAARRLAEINRQVTVDAHAADFSPRNAETLGVDADVIVDGTDNFETRFLLNDLAVKTSRPYVYAGVVAARGTAFTVLPHTPGGETPWEQAGRATPCLRCVLNGAPVPGTTETCDTAGVLGAAVTFVASRQATEALKALLGAFERIEPAMWVVDLWSNEMRRFDVRGAYEPGACVCCGERKFEYLEGRGVSATTQLCGRDAVQVTPSDRPTASIDLDAIAARLGEHGEVRRTKFMVRVDLVDAGRPLRLTVFPDGRTIVHGTDEPSAARAVCARYLGM